MTRCSPPTSPTPSSRTPSWSPLPRTVGALRPRSRRRPGRRRHRRVSTSQRAQEALETYRPIFEARLRVRGAPAAGGVRHAGGRRRAQLRPGRQPAAGHRQGAALPRAVRARGDPPAAPTPTVAAAQQRREPGAVPGRRGTRAARPYSVRPPAEHPRRKTINHEPGSPGHRTRRRGSRIPKPGGEPRTSGPVC